jgi:hypothetical protein
LRSADPDLTVALGAGALDEQERCSPTATITATTWENPWFQLWIDEWNLEAAGYTVPVSGVTVTGAFAPDGSRLQGVTASASLDTRPLGEAFGLGADPDAPCQLIAAFGVSCLECADGTGRYCVDVYLDDLDGPQIPGLTVVDRTETDVASDPTCP